jgi:hypothetical protein
MKHIGEMVGNPADIALARHIAEQLNDKGSLAYYFILAQTYSHDLLKEVLEEVLKIPQEKINTRRAAIFVANIKRYAPR